MVINNKSYILNVNTMLFQHIVSETYSNGNTWLHSNVAV